MIEKIRHKSGVEITGKFQLFVQGSVAGNPRHFWIEPNNAASQYSCDEWKAVPEWVDVTGQCEFNEIDMTLRHGDEPFLGVLSKGCKDMRLRKVCRGELIPGDRAFIVVRKT